MSRPALRIEYPLSREQCIAAGRLTEARTARAWADDLLRPHGLETLDAGLGGPDDEDALTWVTIPNPKGWTLVLSPVAERTRDAVGDEPLTPLPNGTRLEELGWGVDGVPWNGTEPEYVSVAGDDLPRPAAALVTAWWTERMDAGTIPRRRAVDQPSSPSTGRGRVLYDVILTGDALRYADALEREARDVRAEVEQARARDDGRDAEYADALERLAVVERAEGKYDADTTDHAVTRAADAIRTGRARVTSAADAGLAGEGWVLTTKPAPEPDGE